MDPKLQVWKAERVLIECASPIHTFLPSLSASVYFLDATGNDGMFERYLKLKRPSGEVKGEGASVLAIYSRYSTGIYPQELLFLSPPPPPTRA